jgi:hypothetical protein
MESKKLFRIALALAVGASGSAMYGKDALALTCPQTSAGGSTWNPGTNCTAPNGSTAWTWGEVDPWGGQHLKGTANGPPPDGPGACDLWKAYAMNGSQVIKSMTVANDGSTQSDWANGATQTKINYVSIQCPPS